MSRQRSRPRGLFRCGHPRTTHNTAKSGPNGEACRTCKLAYQQRYREQSVPLRHHVRATLDLSNDPAVALCRAEKARRADRPNLVMDDAKRMLAEQLARVSAERKGGRPRTFRPAVRSTDLADHLPPFTHRHVDGRR